MLLLAVLLSSLLNGTLSCHCTKQIPFKQSIILSEEIWNSSEAMKFHAIKYFLLLKIGTHGVNISYTDC